MLKKLILLIAVSAMLMAQAQTGDWRVHPYYVGSQITNLIDTDNKIYYLVGNDLFCFDKATMTNEPINKRNKLNDVLITNIYYNYDKKYLVVAYLNSNIDVIRDDGTVLNLPDIKDAVLTGLKGINDVTFGGGKMMVATEFGMIVYDDTSLTVDESRLFNINLSSVAQVGQWTLISYGNVVYAAVTDGTRENLSSYKVVNGVEANAKGRIIPVSSNKFMFNGDSGLKVYTVTQSVDPSTNQPVFNATVSGISGKRAATVQPTPTGFVVSFLPGTQYVTLNAQAGGAQVFESTDEIFSSCPSADGTMWALGEGGLHQAGSTTTYYKPNGIGIKVGAYYMTFNKAKNLVYLSTSSDNAMAEWGSGLHAVTQIFTYDGNQWTDVTPSSLPGNGVSANWQLVMDPMDPNTYVYPSRKYGVFKITNDQYQYAYATNNSYFAASSYYKGACAFDAAGNLWVVYSSEAASAASAVNVSVLPRAKYEQPTCTKADWIPVSVPPTKQKYFKSSSFAIGKGDVKVYNGGGYQGSFVFWNQPDGLTGEPLIANYNSLQDTDGKSITWINTFCMERDLDGLVWAGMNNGIIAFDPSQAFGDDFAVIHPKVARTDGSGLADHLLDGIQVNCIAVDAANCKWIGTNTNGLYQVSPDGTKILKQFNTDNSYLPSNTIYAVCCNTNTNSVYVLTANGLVEYLSDASPAATSYDDVYAYPNPVRPDFTGLLTISNLMPNSHLRVTNAQGVIVKQWQATGGTATWDCCDTNGQRMPTGLYTISASQRADDSNPTRVAQVLIIR